MAFIQKTTPPPNKVLNFNMKNFVGGLNNRSEQLEDNQSNDIINMMFADETLMETRYGQKYFDVLDLDDELVFIDEYRPYNDTDKLIRATKNKLYVNNTLLIGSLLSKPCCVNHQGRYFIADANKLYVYGKFAQATASPYTVVTGTPINDYVLMEIVSPPAGYTKLDTTHVQGVMQINYTTMKVWYEPCTNEFNDTYNGANVVPTGVKYIVSHNGRLFATGDDKDDDGVFITHVQNPFYFPVVLPLRIPPNSDKVTGLHVYDDSVVVGRNNDLYAVLGNTNKPNMGVDVFQLRKINSHTGFANHDAVDIAHNYLFFLGGDGNMYSLASTRQDEKILSTSILNRTIDLEKAPISVTRSDVKKACSIFFNDEWYVSVGDKVLVYSYRHRAWTMYNQVYARYFYKYNDELIWGRPDGRTAQFDKDIFMDFGVPFESHWYSKIYDMGDASLYKQFREFYLVAHTYQDYISDINVLFEVDYIDIKDRLKIVNQISVWGRAKWGDRFITRNIVESLPFIIGRRGRNIRFKFSNGYFVHTTVTNLVDLETVLGKAEGVLVYVTNENKYYLYINNEWVQLTNEQLNQRMKIYQVNGDYELRGKR